uniref:Transposase n=1 Tax=Peronospora matthiolae TaxID=2874970 RepID=A0AAV1VE14_9STRA
MEGKQTCNAQQDSGENAPIDRIGGVICSDLKGPTEDAAAKHFEAFLTHFKKQFDCRIHVYCTDGDGEYANVDLFFKRTGVERQISEARNRAFVFACALLLNFWGDAVLYAVYALNRSPTRLNPKRVSPLKMLTGTALDLRQIIVYGS